MARSAKPLPQSPAKRGPGRPRKPPVAAAPKLSKDELRARVAKLERANEALRAKAKALKLQTDARIADLEAQLTALQAAPTKPARAKRPRRTVDPGDAVPPGVAVLEPAPMDAEAEAVLEKLDERLHGE